MTDEPIEIHAEPTMVLNIQPDDWTTVPNLSYKSANGTTYTATSGNTCDGCGEPFVDGDWITFGASPMASPRAHAWHRACAPSELQFT